MKSTPKIILYDFLVKFGEFVGQKYSYMTSFIYGCGSVLYEQLVFF